MVDNQEDRHGHQPDDTLGQAQAQSASGEQAHPADNNAQEAKPKTLQHEEPFLRFRLTYLDTVQSSPFTLPPPPTATDKSTPFIPARRIPFVPPGSNIQADRIPELRIFGATEAGQRCCVHVHGALPYVYVEYEGKVAPEEVHTYINRLARAINVCMAASLNRRDPTKSIFVAFIVPVKGVPFYGFHVGYRYFLKIYCLDPKFMTRMTTLLRSGEIMRKKFIVYEAHIPFHLQFMLDTNLFGCGWVDISKAKFREPVPEDSGPDGANETSESGDSNGVPLGAQYGMSDESGQGIRLRKAKRYTRSKIPQSMLYSNANESPPRVAHSELEFDIHVSWVLNRHLVQERNLHADFTEFLSHPIPDDFKFVHSVRELWEDERRRRQMKGLEGPFEISENSAEELLGGLSAGKRSSNNDRMYGIGTQPPWMAHNQNLEHFQNLIDKDRAAYTSNHASDPDPKFEAFVKGEKKGGWMERIRTTFQSVEALFEETMDKDEQESNPFGAWGVRGVGVTVPLGTSHGQAQPLPEDVNPQYLAMLSTQVGRNQLAQMELEAAENEDEYPTEPFDGTGVDQEIILASDEEELVEQDDVRQVQEAAKRKVRHGASRGTALAQAQRDVRPSSEESLSDYRVEGAFPMGGQGPAKSRDASVSSAASRGTSVDSVAPAIDETAPEERLHKQSSKEALNQAREINDEDIDVILLEQLVPLDSDMDWSELDTAKAEVKDEEAEGMLDNSPPTSINGKDRAAWEGSGTQSARMGDPGVVKQVSAQGAGLKETRSGAQDTPAKPLPNYDAPLESARPYASPVSANQPWARGAAVRQKPDDGIPSPPKKVGVSPNKSNYFSPAKSKLRNAVINPTFVGEAKLKRKREDDLIGFRAIGDHGRTTLQRMLDVQTKPRQPKKSAAAPPDSVIATKPAAETANVETLSLDAGANELADVYPDSIERQDNASDFLATNSDDDKTEGSAYTPLKVLLTSCEDDPPFNMAGANTAEVASSPTRPVKPAEVSSLLPESEDTSQWRPYTPTQVILSQGDSLSSAQGPTVQHATHSSSPSSSEGLDRIPTDLSKGPPLLSPRRSRAVRFQSVPDIRDTTPVSDDMGTPKVDANVSFSGLMEESNGPLTEPDPDESAAVTTVSTYQQSQTGYANGNSGLQHGGYRLAYVKAAPLLADVLKDMDERKILHKVYPDAYWSNLTDLPQHPFEYAGRRYTHRADANRYLQIFQEAVTDKPDARPYAAFITPILGVRSWEYSKPPPSRARLLKAYEDERPAADVKKPRSPTFARSKVRILDTQWHAKSQIEGPTQHHPFGAKYGETRPSNVVVKEKEHMSALAIELHVNTRGSLLPDPTQDPIEAIFYCLQNEDEAIPDNGRKEGQYCGIIAVRTSTVVFLKLGLTRYTIDLVEDEMDLVKCLVEKVQSWDPEIFTGYDVLKDSWGYFVERVDEIAPELDIVMELSRVKSQSTGRRGSKAEDRWGYSKGATLKVTGRHILPVWRLLKSDVNLCIYSLENVCFHILRQRIPRFSPETLTGWYTSDTPHLLVRVLQYHLLRAQLVIELLEEAEIVSRNAEFARVFGVDFYSVLTRGSQFKVESVMFKITKPENFMLPSPSREDVGKQNAAECIPLILEPQSGFYSSPLLVFDFQSLYPSVMIAYNLCYSTCLGRLKEFMGTNRLGTSSLAIPTGSLTLLKDWVTLSPNGLMFLKPQVRRSMLSKMLTEILDTRVMIKKSMKLIDENDRALLKLLNARQLGLKFIANVTYGYTSATFSGRMPCVEIADAIVQTGRETLERAKNTIQSRPDWGAIVRYGDTDSLFVHLPGKTKDEAFKIGNDIAETITRLNPKPVKLKFEKVYLPSFLLAKKRYVGFKFESPADLEPEFDAKGIETVRRDGFPAMQKMLETCIKILFRTSDLSAVKLYVQQQFVRIMQNRSSPQDFIYAKEVKMGSYSDKVTPPPGAVVTARRMLVDPRTEALYGERVPYIITRGIDGPKAKQAARALTPEEFLADRENALDDLHYIGRIVKTLNRLFFLVGVDTQDWWNAAPRRRLAGKSSRSGKGSKARVDQHFSTITCPVCGSRKSLGSQLCAKCLDDPVGTTMAMQTRTHHLEHRVQVIRSTCGSCAGLPVHEADACDSVDCPILYSRVKSAREVETATETFRNLDQASRINIESDAQNPVYLVV